MKLLRLPGRFEWKILLALFTVASLPLGATAYLMSVTIGRIEAITDQHQEAVRKSLGGAVEVYKAYFEKMKDSFHARTAEIAASPTRARGRSGGRPRPPACADPLGRARRRRVVGAAGGDRRCARGAAQPRRAAGDRRRAAQRAWS